MNFLLRNTLLINILNCFLFMSSVYASPTPLPGYNLKALLMLGLKNSPDIKKAKADYEAKKAETRKARALLLPTVDLKATTSETNLSNNALSFAAGRSVKDYQAYAEASQPLYVGGAITDGLSYAKKNELISQLSLAAQEQNTLGQVISAYYRIAEFTKKVMAAEKNRDVLNEHALTIRKYEKIGRARRTDFLIATVNATRAEEDLRALQVELEEKNSTLKKLLAFESIPNIEVSDSTEIDKKSKSLDQLLQKAFKENIHLKIAQIQFEQIDNEKNVALSEDRPSLYLKGLAGYRAQDDTDLLKTDSQYSAISIELKVPLFSGLSSFAKRRGFNERKISLTRTLESLKLNLESDISSKYRDYNNVVLQLDEIKNSQNLINEAVKLANRDYARSLISSQDVTHIQRTNYETKISLIEAQYNYLNLALELQILTGENLIEHY